MQGSQAYARALAKAGVLTDDESSKIQEGLGEVAKEWESEKFEVHHQPLHWQDMQMWPCRGGDRSHVSSTRYPCTRKTWLLVDLINGT